MNKTESTYNFDDILSTGVLPKSGSPDVARFVVDLHQRYLDNLRPYHQVADLDRNYYQGIQCETYRKGDQKTYENAVLRAIETMKPGIAGTISAVTVSPTNQNDVEAVESLNQRIKWAMCKSDFEKQKPDIIEDVTVDGTAFIRVFKDVTFERADNRGVLFDVTVPFDESFAIIDQILLQKADLKMIFGKQATRAKADYDEMPSKEGETSGVYESTGYNTRELVYDWGVGIRGTAYTFEDFEAKLTKTKKVLVLSCCVRDKSGKFKKTVDEVRDPETGEVISKTENTEYVLDYPYGRHIYVAVGADSKGSEEGDSIVLRDTPFEFPKLYQNTNRFNYVQMICYKGKGNWGMSVVTPLRPLQDALNFGWKRLYENVKYIVKPIRIIAARSGIKKYNLTSSNQTDIYLEDSCALSPKEAIHYVPIPDIVNKLLEVISSARYVIKEISGTLDVMQGAVPTGVTAGVAIERLQGGAMGRPQLKGMRISQGMEQVVETMAYIAQERDGITNGVYEPGEMEFPDDSGEEQKFIKYDPEKVRNSSFYVKGVRKKTPEEIAQILMTAANLEKSGVSPELYFRYIQEDDPTLVKLYMDIKAKQEQAMAEQQAQMMAMEDKKMKHQSDMADRQSAMSLTQTALAQRNQAQQANKPQPKD